MPPETAVRYSVDELAAKLRQETIPLTNTFSYVSALPLAEEDVKQYLRDPVAALPPKIVEGLPAVRSLLAPYIERGNGAGGDVVTFDRPAESRLLLAARRASQDGETLVFGIKDEDVADYHYTFYNALARVAAENAASRVIDPFVKLVSEELGAEVHGEVDEAGWRLKQALLRRQTNVRRETKLFRTYVAQAFEDTLTLYLHGICCDIDVETGPRKLSSRHLRKRLELLEATYPPPEGYAVFPDHARKRRK
jgi:hypothetical protein